MKIPALNYYIRGSFPPEISMFFRYITIFSLFTWTLALSTLYQFPNNGSFVDNIALRSNGHLIVTRIDVPQIWSVEPTARTASLVHDFGHDNSTITGCFGIVEVEPDIFVVVTGGIDIKSFSFKDGTFSLWMVDFNAATVSQLLAIPEAKALSAVTKFGNLLLLADSPEGAVWRVDLQTGEYAKAIVHESMLPVPNGPPMGINGIKVLNGYLYYASSTRKEFRRVRINEHSEAIGSFEMVSNNTAPDNFDLDEDGTAYIATNGLNSIVKILPDGQLDTIVGGEKSTELLGPTSCLVHGKTLYIGTNGGVTAPVDGFTEPGKIASIHI